MLDLVLDEHLLGRSEPYCTYSLVTARAELMSA